MKDLGYTITAITRPGKKRTEMAVIIGADLNASALTINELGAAFNINPHTLRSRLACKVTIDKLLLPTAAGYPRKTRAAHSDAAPVRSELDNMRRWFASLPSPAGVVLKSAQHGRGKKGRGW